MVDRIDIDTQGFKELDKALGKLPVQVEKRVLNRSLIGAMRAGAKHIKARAPKHTGKQSPASMKYKPIKRNIKASMIKQRKRWVKSARIHTADAFWAMFYELGTSRQPARPFFLPAFRSGTSLILKEFQDRLKKGIEQEAEKLKNGG